MPSLLNVIFNATAISALYAIIAIGFTLIFGVGGVLNFAHGALIAVGGFAAYVVANPSWYGQSLGPLTPHAAWVGLLAGAVVGGLVALILYAGVVRHVMDRPVTILILTFVLGFFIQHALRIFIANHRVSVPLLIPGGTTIAGEGIRWISVFIFLLSWGAIGAVFGIVNYTKTGKAILATSMSDKGAALVGIDAERINLYTWLLAGTFAGIAGVLLTMIQTGQWNMGTEPLILSFAIVILGGLGSIRGSVVGAYIIGFTETITTSYIDTRLTGLTALVLLIAFLLVKPEGLFGREAAE